MTRNKWDATKIAFLPLPFLFLAAYATKLPLPLPAFLTPQRSYLALGGGVDRELLQKLRGRGEAYAVLADRLLPLPPAGGGRVALDASIPALPDEAPLGAVIRDIAEGLGPLRRARLVISRPPLAGEIEALAAAAKGAGAPLAIELLPTSSALPLAALSLRYAPLDRRLGFELLLGPEARAYATIEVAAEAKTASARGGELLFRSSGAELPADLVLRLSVDRSTTNSIVATFTDTDSRRRSRRLALGSGLEAKPGVLVISERRSATSFVESLYPARRATPQEAEGLDLLSFELVVIDGIPLKRIKGRLLAGLLDLAERRAGSLLFAADSPDFGTKGDNPELEALLPAILLPRSIKDLPDLAILVLLDVSGSMFGDKLSLAKVSGLELLRNLKAGDLVGLVFFSDIHSWIYEFIPNSSIVAAPVLEPLTAGGGTDLSPALVEGLGRLARLPIKDKHAVLITDGVTKPADFQAIADRARAGRISISTMGIGEDVNRPLLERLALRTGGRYYRVASADEIPALLFEDRKSVARPSFMQGRIPVLALNGERVAEIGGMAQYAPAPTASILFTNDLGDPLLASNEYGNRAVVLFASDLYGSYTSDFFAAPAAAGAFKDRLDALFSEKPAEISVTEASRGLRVLVRSERLAAPRLLLSREGGPTLDLAFDRVGPLLWAAEAVTPYTGEWSASIIDRGGGVASFPLVFNGGLEGIRSDAARAFDSYRPSVFRIVRSPEAWLLLFFLASLASTVVLRVKR